MPDLLMTPAATRQPLGRDFFARPIPLVAAELVGKLLRRRLGRETIELLITETEAYGGSDDPASHAYRGQTPRNWPMFAAAGHLYIYLSYGIHRCLNVSAGSPGTAGAVLLRAGIVLPGCQAILGPGRLGRRLELQLTESGDDSCHPAARLTWADVGKVPQQLKQGPRIGISQGRDLPWRFWTTEWLPED